MESRDKRYASSEEFLVALKRYQSHGNVPVPPPIAQAKPQTRNRSSSIPSKPLMHRMIWPMLGMLLGFFILIIVWLSNSGSNRRKVSETQEGIASATPALSEKRPEVKRDATPSQIPKPTTPPPSKESNPKPPKRALDEEITNSIGMKFRLIRPGTFRMGSPASESGRDNDETQHSVTISKPYYLGIYEVTQEQYERVMGKNPSYFKGARDPVENVSWEDAVAFIEKLNGMPSEKDAGRVYRLPTEAEWEYACRAGSESAYCFGDTLVTLQQYAWFGENSGSKTHPVGKKQPNAWGLYDMHGNVWEWCYDWDGDYSSAAVADPSGPARGSYRVLRGGSWVNEAALCRSARRRWFVPSFRFNSVGFRVALSSTGIPK
jgi:formylglycine-generating enzyme required for sulfatase activity